MPLYKRFPLLQTARTNVWPTAVQLHAKLYGSNEGLEEPIWEQRETEADRHTDRQRDTERDKTDINARQ